MLRFKKFLIEKSLKATKVGEMDDSEKMLHTQNKAEGDNWHRDHPVNHMNIVDHWNKSTPDERHNGTHWYKDAQHFSQTLAKDTGVSHKTMAGLTANYSPQTDWHTNMLTAARVARHKVAVGGPKQEPFMGKKAFASEDQRKNGERILGGEDYNNVLKGHKIRHFGHLIEHGGDADSKNPHVAIDRHAYSVAAGARITDQAFGSAGLKSPKKYTEMVGHYKKAADHINSVSGAKEGDANHIKPHQVQAVTWLTRQRLNNEEDSAAAKGTGKKGNWGKVRSDTKSTWSQYAKENHPKIATQFESYDNEGLE